MISGRAIRDERGVGTRVHLVVDNALLRAGLERLLRDGGVVVSASSEDPAEALTSVTRAGTDVLLVDLRKPGGDGFEWALRLSREVVGVPTLLVLENPAPDQVRLALEAGIECVLAPDEDPSELFIAIDTLRRGKTYLSPRLVPAMMAAGVELDSDGSSSTVHLSRLEIDIVRCLALGRVAAEVARDCGLPESTAEELIAEVGDKLECHSAADFARFAIRAGYLPRRD